LQASGRTDRDILATDQSNRLAQLLRHVYGRNPFYTRKLDTAGLRPESLTFPRDLSRLPLTTKQELMADQQQTPPFGTNLTEPIAQYTRYNQTSSTTGRPLRWLDTNESWQWMLECWKAVYAGARVDARDRILFPFSFGPFLGFWTAFEAGCQIGAQCIPAGGMTSHARLKMVEQLQPTVVCCTPTYALRLLEVAREMPNRALDLARSSVRALIVAGEAGGSVGSTRERIERGWGARVIDHHGLTEVGPISFECWESPGGLHLNEAEYICEVLRPESGIAATDGERGELVITNLGRAASPLIRYRTGDIVVRTTAPCACGRVFARLEGGVLTRVDDMVTVRGVNVFPTAVEAIVRRFPEVAEYRATVATKGSLRELTLEIELVPAVDGESVPSRLNAALSEALGLSVPLRVVESGMLPRFEMKGRRFVIQS